jgi:hypothetical protein
MSYPFTPEWKEQVSKQSEEWLRYQAAVNSLKKYFATKAKFGKDAARQEFAVTCHLIGRQGDFGREQAQRLREVFLLVGTEEGRTIEAEVVDA